ncbi:MAG: beta-N-acetylhexosaminidase [Candidatus Cloacimonadaceae bacterium]|nr:beta-N-acetylhexosaminidase [Candidatus Cloacimonadaceae bacterium]
MIPKPFSETLLPGSCRIPERVVFQVGTASDCTDAQGLSPKETQLFGDYLLHYIKTLRDQFGYAPPAGEISVRMTNHSEASSEDESYTLEIEPGGMSIEAPSMIGARQGYQSLLQLIYAAIKDNSGSIPCRAIKDHPRYTWRGLHLDVSRHFFDEDFIIQYLEWMEALKLNRFHWHLSDDQGWRLESERFPDLHEKGAWRVEADGSTYGGYYPKDQIKRIVDYASSMGIEVIPEIDIPGHAQAILAAYPHLACFPDDFSCLNVWGISDNILCAGNDAVLIFLEELLSEVAKLFPGRYIHLGGDEAPKDKWKLCPQCQARIKSEGLKDEEELQSWLLKRLTLHLKTLGKEVIGWDEILDGDIDTEPIVMVWRGDGKDAARKAHQNGNRYILCPNSYLYFDWKQSSAPGEQGAHGVSTLANVYGYEPGDCESEDPALLLGAQANVWTEYMHDPNEVKHMLFPRIYALAEMLWSPQSQRDWDDFLIRLKALEGYL